MRGSGRFAEDVGRAESYPATFNPLHCGAVVASQAPPTRRRRVGNFQSPSLRGSGRFRSRRGVRRKPARAPFNPLHCGAVVASTLDEEEGGAGRCLSIPFIAGQWSLLEALRRALPALPPFNPLHCGAVVASERALVTGRPVGLFLSIPFIAGQWSLPAAGTAKPPGPWSPFNPLHCGAVVASGPAKPSSFRS